MAAVRAANAGEAVGKVAALKVIVNHFGNNRAEETVVLGESFVIALPELVEITIQQVPQWRLFW